MTGLIVNFTVEDETASADHLKLCGQLLAAGCTVQLPKPPKSGDVFKRACKTVPVPDGYVWMGTGLETSHDRIWKTIAGALPESVWHIGLDKNTEKVSCSPINGPINGNKIEPPAALTSFVDDLADYMTQNSTKLRAYALREYTRRTLTNELFGVVTDFGVLIPESCSTPAQTFCDVINALGGCTVDCLPLVETDSGDVARLVTSSLQAETDMLQAELEALAASKVKFTKTRLESFGLRIDTIRGKLAAFNCSDGVDLTVATDSFYAVAGQVKL